MEIYTFPLGQLQANCYFIVKDRGCIIIDPADEAQFILEEISRRNLKVHALVATHGHFDHVMAAGEIQLAIPGTPFYLSSKDTFLINRLSETAKYFLGYDPQVIPPQSSNPLLQGKLKLGPFSFEAVETPGHTPGSCSLYFEKDQILFSGDTLFKGSIGRYDFSYSSKDDLKLSLNRLLKLPGNTKVYPGHGSPTSIVEESNITRLFF